MFYLWKYDTQGKGDFFRCGIEQFNGRTNIAWTLGKKIDLPLPEILKYYAENMLLPEDFPLTGSTEFLVSGRIVKILKQMKVTDIDYYDSIIIRPNNTIIKEFSTLNILRVIKCIDFERSIYVQKTYGPAQTYHFSKLVLDQSQIPTDARVFRLEEKKFW
jgi:hypothetical protein